MKLNKKLYTKLIKTQQEYTKQHKSHWKYKTQQENTHKTSEYTCKENTENTKNSTLNSTQI